MGEEGTPYKAERPGLGCTPSPLPLTFLFANWLEAECDCSACCQSVVFVKGGRSLS